jgi:hypothetical protein
MKFLLRLFATGVGFSLILFTGIFHRDDDNSKFPSDCFANVSDFIPIYHFKNGTLVRGTYIETFYPSAKGFENYSNVSKEIRDILYIYVAINLCIILYYSFLICNKKKSQIARKLEIVEQLAPIFFGAIVLYLLSIR